ncbi:MAG TPA: hypothetical protein PLN63_00900 [Paludibacteraceae bacterium]|jgi:hypothetical protein|nr:hypothetical protein [Paludibacteraceae bacterium]
MKKRNVLRTILGSCSLTASMFVFQACYGMPDHEENDTFIEGQVTSAETGLPLPGVIVSWNNGCNDTLRTDTAGRFSMYAGSFQTLKLRFEYPESLPGTKYAVKDTVVTGDPNQELVKLNLNIALAKK